MWVNWTTQNGWLLQGKQWSREEFVAGRTSQVVDTRPTLYDTLAEDIPPVAFEPGLGIAPGGEEFPHHALEALGMVHFPDMG